MQHMDENELTANHGSKLLDSSGSCMKIKGRAVNNKFLSILLFCKHTV